MAAVEDRPAAPSGPPPGRKPTPKKGGGATGALSDPTIAGAIIILVAVIATVLSYNANRGLPFVPSYDMNVAVPDAAELIAGSSEVRVSGSRIGIVRDIQAIPARGDNPPYALLKLRLDKDQELLPVDTRAAVKPRSVLGAKYVDLTKGTSSRGIAAGGTLPLANAIESVEIDQAFKLFEPETRQALRAAIGNLADATVGRGAAINQTITSTNRLLGPLNRTLQTLIDPDTGLAGTIRAADGATAALAPVAGEIASILGDAPTTLQALDAAKPELQESIELLAGTADAGRAAAGAAAPVLARSAVLFRDLRPGVEVLPSAARRLTRALAVGTPILGRVPATARRLDTAVGLLEDLVEEDTTLGAVVRLTDTVRSLGPTLDVLGPAQISCNVGANFVNNIASVVSEGDVNGTWLDQNISISPTQSFRQARQSPDLHANPVPVNDAQQCETGNEPFESGRRVGSPGGDQPARTKVTRPPAGVPAFTAVGR